jgi:hypothetical protein
MKERPILFKGEMVRAILSGQKTQTRRVIKEQPEVTEKRLRETGGWVEGMTLSQLVNESWQSGFINVPCPHGKAGGRLWVRECWVPSGCEGEAYYHATAVDDGLFADEVAEIRWKPSIHMPRWACRLVLEIVSVRVERLNEISKEDAIAEGIKPHYSGWWPYSTDYFHADGVTPANFHKDPRESFRSLWVSINGLDSWAANPWVWVIEFKRVSA